MSAFFCTALNESDLRSGPVVELKPPFPSGGGCAAASAGRRSLRCWDANPVRVVRFDKGDSKAHLGRPLDGRPTPL